MRQICCKKSRSYDEGRVKVSRNPDQVQQSGDGVLEWIRTVNILYTLTVGWHLHIVLYGRTEYKPAIVSETDSTDTTAAATQEDFCESDMTNRALKEQLKILSYLFIHVEHRWIDFFTEHRRKRFGESDLLLFCIPLLSMGTESWML